MLPEPAEVMTLLSETSAVLLRQFAFTPDSFVAFSDQCCSRFSTYAGGAARLRSLDRTSFNSAGTLMSTTGGGQGFPIPLHGEMYYQRERPDVLWFFCKQAPKQMGQTTLAHGHELFLRLPERSKGLLRTSRLKYIRDLAVEDWPTMFQTSDLATLRRICKAGNALLTVRPDRSVRIEFSCSALTKDSEGKELFLNSLIMVLNFEQTLTSGSAADALGADLIRRPPLVVRFEDDSRIPEWLVEDVEAVSSAVTHEVCWQTGDLLILDNRRVLHGRRRAIGDDREILVRLGDI
jgi:alpha-ketoglutarate-dependent taurine dioxygenase